MKEKIYRLERDFSHVGDADNDLSLVTFPGSQDIGSKIIDIESFTLPDILYFQADFSVIPEIDFPVPDIPTILLMSNKMVTALKQCGIFVHRSIPAVLIDDTFFGQLFNANGELNPEAKTNREYQVIQLLSYTDAFDRDRSEYKMSRAFPDQVSVIKKLVFKESVSYPPIFKIKEKMEAIYITEQVKNVLESTGIKGCEYTKI